MEMTLLTPFGPLLLTVEEDRLTAVHFGLYHRDRALRGIRAGRKKPSGQDIRLLIEELNRYFSGVPTDFSVPLDLGAHTDFQRSVWKAIQAVPYGRTTTYGQLAADLGDRNAARAVGAALGQNPFPILIPCHRAVGSTGALTGFGGGLEWKRALLSLECGQGELF